MLDSVATRRWPPVEAGRRAGASCAGLISLDTLIGRIRLDEEHDQETKMDIQRGVQVASRAADSPAGLERGRCLPRHEALNSPWILGGCLV